MRLGELAGTSSTDYVTAKRGGCGKNDMIETSCNRVSANICMKELGKYLQKSFKQDAARPGDSLVRLGNSLALDISYREARTIEIINETKLKVVATA